MKAVLLMVVAAIFIAAIGITSIILGSRPKLLTYDNMQSTENTTPAEYTMTFEVKIPSNTIDGDTIYIYTHGDGRYKMEDKGNLTYGIDLTEEQLRPEDGEIRYRYSRNGYDFHTAEYLEPDTNDYFWTQRGRSVTYEDGKVQQDVIPRWRWFPQEGMITKTTSLVPERNFLPRINNVEFRSGQTIEDLYSDAYYEFFNSTAKHMRRQGYNWVQIAPPWQWAEEDGLPKVMNDFKNNPNYPDDQTFIDEVLAYKREGLKVHIEPQICCTAINSENRSAEWWRAYFDETERFLVHFAELAQQTDADAFSYAVFEWDDNKIPLDSGQEWRDIFVSINNVFDGDVGQMVWILGPEVSPSPHPIPEAKIIKWADQLDFILVATEFPLSEKENPTDDEFAQKAGQVIDGIKQFYDELGTPVIIRNGYFNVKYTWKGQTFYSISSVPWIAESESKMQESIYEFNTEDHARVVNAYFKAIADRPWVIGYAHFGYTHWEDPLSAWMSIRGKPAEDIWGKWNGVIFG